MARKQLELSEILVDMGVLKPEDARLARETAATNHQRMEDVLISGGLVNEDVVTKGLAIQYDMAYIDLDKNQSIGANVDLIPQELIRRHQVIPIAKEGGRLRLIIGDPTDIETLDTLRFRLNVPLEPCLAVKSKIKSHIDKLFADEQKSIDEAIRLMSVDRGASIDMKAVAADSQAADDAPVIKLVAAIISEAVRSRASDIHIEPMKDRVRVRYRIDGVCMERDNIPKRMQGPVLARIKIMSGMDIAEKRLPQDGRIKMSIDGSRIDFRVSSLPGYHGESTVLRILRPDNVNVGLQALGFEEDDYQRFKRIISRPNGIFLVTGPTGSGKTTTLYAALAELNKPDRKIITAEDPVEYNFPGINQCQVRDIIGLSFAKILRAMLRQAPNIILVGEIRDLEVAEVAIQAALTGHLVFSTLHTNDAPSAVTRLIDMGVKPFLVASSIQAIMAQRLIRLLCKECRAPDPNPDRRMLQLMGLTDRDIEGRTLYKAVGCPKCNNTGYRGRKGIFEMLSMNAEVRELAFKRAPTNQIRKAAKATGMRSLLEDGRIKILSGISTLEEVARTTQAEGIIQD